MARLWCSCYSFCVIFFSSSLFLQVFASQDTYLYNADISPHRTDSHISLQLLEPSQFSHNLHRRQTDSSSSRSAPQQPIADNRSNQQFPVASTSPTVNEPKTLDVANKSPLAEPTNSTAIKNVLQKNLGENGAGIRQNVTAVPPAILPPQANDDLIVAKNNQTGGDDDEISISKFADDEANMAAFNKSLEQHNITQTKTDGHIYYNSTFMIDPQAGTHYWVDMENNRSDVKINALLSKSHRRAATVKLSFDFPFYGDIVRNITIATGGFLYTGEYVHSWLAATQYIAPLMANFDTSLSNDSYIKYVDNGTAFTVQWERVSLQDKPNDGEFTFQATLLKNGDIIFVYRNVPHVIQQIEDNQHPVKVGLSDAYIFDRTVFFVRRKTIYEYHRVNFNREDIKNWTVIYLSALPTCLDSKDCYTCLTKKISFDCTWCPVTNRCSNGFDRDRQQWLMKGCDKKQFKNESLCLATNDYDHLDHTDGHEFYYGQNFHPSELDHPFNNPPQVNNNMDNESNNQNVHMFNDVERSRNEDPALDNADKEMNTFSDTVQASRISHSSRVLDPDGSVKMGASGILTILFMITVVGGLGIWVLYAYRNPHTTSGQILIRYRPSQWRWKRGEARYTAATIHM